MSDLIKQVELSDSKDCPNAAKHPLHKKLPTREAHIGEGLTIRRALPHKDRRMIGAWCFLDHFGPLDLKTSGLSIAPHPHMGLQTFTWTLQGEIIHRDSLGYEQIIKPGQVNLMTAGYGISHSEESLPDTTLHGVQLWIALPDSVRNQDSDFHHYEAVPLISQDNINMHLLAGNYGHASSPAHIHTPLIGLALHAQDNTQTVLTLESRFEYGILPLIGSIETDNTTCDENSLLYLGSGRKELNITMKKGDYALLLGGVPFDEEILMWWNFVARSEDEIISAIQSWENHQRFGEVKGYPGQRLDAPSF